jgi:pyruvate,water dikinase
MHDTPIDPLHRVSGPHTAWTRVNIAEGIPGVSTPLSWSWWDEANELMIRGAYRDIGVVSSVEIPEVHQVDERASAIFYGRPVLNVDVSRRMADLQPGTSGEALERHYFGAVRPDAPSAPSRRRYPAIALKLPGQWRRVPGLLEALYRKTHSWWQDRVAPGALDDVGVAREALKEARIRFGAIARPHSVLALLGGALIQQVTIVAERAGRPELVLDALGGYDSVEFETLQELLFVRRGELSLEEFLARRGFQGPHQGEMSSVSWREDPRPVESLLASLDPAENPVAEIAAERAREREVAEQKICRGLGPLRRLWARWLFSEAARMLPQRETGKAAMMLCMDVARACARRLGADLAVQGAIEDPEDVFYLTLEEILGELPADARLRIASRRKQREEYLQMELPESWVGMVEPLQRAEEEDEGPLAGLGVSPGIAEGSVRLVRDGSGELNPGEILVCETTDPSYAAYFLVAEGVITDIGGAMGHGAIVAREVGIPCVVNTRVATRRLQTGDRVRINGTSGSIEVLSTAGDASKETIGGPS